MICSSFAWPNMFDVARSKVNLYTDTKSITNRVKLLLLTDPTEMHMNPNFGVGLRRYIYTYNNDNVIALIRDKLIDQLQLWEPGVIAEETTVSRGISNESADYSAFSTDVADLNKLELTITLKTAYAGVISFSINQHDIEGLV